MEILLLWGTNIPSLFSEDYGAISVGGFVTLEGGHMLLVSQSKLHTWPVTYP